MTADQGRDFALSIPEMAQAVRFPYDSLEMKLDDGTDVFKKMIKLGGMSIVFNARIREEPMHYLQKERA